MEERIGLELWTCIVIFQSCRRDIDHNRTKLSDQLGVANLEIQRTPAKIAFGERRQCEPFRSPRAMLNRVRISFFSSALSFERLQSKGGQRNVYLRFFWFRSFLSGYFNRSLVPALHDPHTQQRKKMNRILPKILPRMTKNFLLNMVVSLGTRNRRIWGRCSIVEQDLHAGWFNRMMWPWVFTGNDP